MRARTALLFPLLLAGCMNTLLGTAGRSVGIPLQEKVVSSKREPNVLVAADGTTCVTSGSRWEKAEVGRPFLCHWQPAA